MSKLFLMALTERLGSGLEHQLPAARAFAVLRLHHVCSFIAWVWRLWQTGLYGGEPGLAQTLQHCGGIVVCSSERLVMVICS